MKQNNSFKMIKKIIVLVFITITLTFNSYAQDFKKLSFQFDAGATVSIPNYNKSEYLTNITDHPETTYLPCSGFFGEIIGTYQLSKKTSLQSGINYSFFRQRIVDEIGNEERKGRIKRSYLQLPVLFRYKLSNNHPLNIGIGPYLGYLTHAKRKGGLVVEYIVPLWNEWYAIPTEADEMDLKSGYYEYDFGLTLQGDYAIALKNQHALLLLLRFNYGLMDITSDKSSPEIGYEERYTRNISLLFGIGYRI
jgi:hypothetical protein